MANNLPFISEIVRAVQESHSKYEERKKKEKEELQRQKELENEKLSAATKQKEMLEKAEKRATYLDKKEKRLNDGGCFQKAGSNINT